MDQATSQLPPQSERGTTKVNSTDDFQQNQPDIKNQSQTTSDDVGSNTDGKPERKEHTRSMMAILFVLGFFAILFLCFVYAIKVGAPLNDLKDTLIGVIGALSGTLGFIVGYYYKATLEQ